MKKDTKQILLIAGLGVGGFLAFNWWKKRQTATAEESSYMPIGDGGRGVKIGVPLWGGGEVCGPCNEGTPEEGDVTTYVKEGGAVLEPSEATEPTRTPIPTMPTKPAEATEPTRTPIPTTSPTRESFLADYLRQTWPYTSVPPFPIPSAPTPTGHAVTTMGRPSYGPSRRGVQILPRRVGVEPESPITPMATLERRTPITVPTAAMGRPSALAPSERGIQKLPRLVGMTPEVSSLRTVPTIAPTVRTTPTMGRPSALAPSERGIQKLPRLVGVTPEISSLRTVPDEKAVTKALAQNRIERSTGVAGVGRAASRRWIR